MITTLTIDTQIKVQYENPNIPVHDVTAVSGSSVRVSELLNIIGGLSEPSKMPGYSYSISAFRCNVGGSLRKVEGSTCNNCYACKGNYVRFPAVQKALQRRYESLFDPRWTSAFIALCHSSMLRKHKFFRWHDSGDLQSYEHLLNIVNIAIHSPHIQFWLPTREYALVDRYLETYGKFPENLTVRVSAHMINKMAPSRFTVTSAVLGRHTSVSDFKQNHPEAYFSVCPAPNQGGKCENCRSCWNSRVSTVIYKEH